MTTLAAASASSTMLVVGERWTTLFCTRDSNGILTSAITPAVLVTKPDASTTAPTPTYVGNGVWTAGYTVTAAGRHLAAVSTPEDTLLFAAFADMSVTAAGMPTYADVVVYLGPYGGTWSVADVTDAFSAERSAQRDRCGERAVYPDALRQALLRRVARNLAMRKLPLAVNVGDSDTPSAILPGRDPEIRRLEAPYRRRPVG